MTTLDFKAIYKIVDPLYVKYSKLPTKKIHTLETRLTTKLDNNIKFNNDFIKKYNILKEVVMFIYEIYIMSSTIESNKKIINLYFKDIIYVNSKLSSKEYLNLINHSINKTLGFGAFGSVYLTTSNNKKYACKIQNEKIFNTNNISLFKTKIGKFKDRITNEYSIGKKLGDHKIGPKVYNNVYFYNTETNTITNIIIMEIIEGESLWNYIYNQHNKLTETQKKSLNNIINKLHKLNIYHGDLHLNNIIVQKNKNKLIFKIIDYGLANYEKDIKLGAEKKNKDILNWIDASEVNNNSIKNDINKIVSLISFDIMLKSNIDLIL